MKRNLSKSITCNMSSGLLLVVLVIIIMPTISNFMKINVIAEINPPPHGEGQIHYHNGDWIIEMGDNIYRGNQTIVLNGNLKILGGILTFQNVTLIMNSTIDGEFEINITQNGKFCVYNSNITAYDTNTPVVYFPGMPWEYTTYGLRYRFRIYGNTTIEDSFVSYIGGEEPNTIGGLEIYSDEVILYRNNIFNIENWSGIYCNQASPIISNNNLFNNGVGIGFLASNGLIAYNNITSNEYGIMSTFSSPIISYNNIISNLYDGISLTGSNALVNNNKISNNNVGIFAGSSSNPHIENNIIENNYEGIYFRDPTTSIIINNIIKDNTNRGIWLTSETNPTIINCTLENNNYAFWCLGSFPVAINTIFDDSKIWLDSSSTLTIKNFLSLLVLNLTSTPISGVDINITDNGKPIYQTFGFGGNDFQTGDDGYIHMLLITDRIYIGSITATENITTVEISYPSMTFDNNPRNVNMSISHTEIFIESGGTILSDLTSTLNDIAFKPTSIVKNNTMVVINATIRNIGPENASNIVVRVYDDPSLTNLIGEELISSIPALGGIGWVEMDWIATPIGWHNIYVVIDPDNLIPESNETNNIANRTIGVGTPLFKGWNLVSIPYIQSNFNLSNILNSIDGLYDAVQWYNAFDGSDSWKHYHISKPSHLNDLSTINHTMSVWIHIIQSGVTIFVWNGTLPNENQSVSLNVGWNLVGYPSLVSYNRTDGLNNITYGSDVDAIWTYNSSIQKWERLGESDYFEIGRGYYIHSKVKKTWIIPL
ncbi:MAG: right-handed parallel beta-helix repeat-containing protein [Thermoplasmata archaeon]|nr:MAG: right-handed parallel beta-helix repeat-containing protein [Thermoplasmata archaeon]